jgi:hypothetical protein
VAESTMPNMNAVRARIQTFGELINTNGSINLAAQEATLETDLTTIFNTTNDPPLINQVLPQQGRNNLPNDIYIYGENFVSGATVQLGIANLPTSFTSSTQLRATVPQDLVAGVYDLKVTNPGGGGTATRLNAYSVLPEIIDDLYGNAYELWSDPSTLHAGEPGQIGLVVHRQGGESPLSNVAVRFYLGNPQAGGVLLGNGFIPSLPARGAESSSGVNWTPDAAGEYTLYAVIDPDHQVPETIETNNVLIRTVTVMPVAHDSVPPQVDSFVINDGNNSITDLTVSLDTTASDLGGSGVASLRFVQYQYSGSADQWLPVQETGWLDYTSNHTNYEWELLSSTGVIYLQAWAMDHAGNISIYPYHAYVDYLPPNDSVAYGQAHIYRYLLNAGQSMTVNVTPLNGDPDLYIWAPDYESRPRPAWVSNVYNGVEELTINAPVGGLYQVEVYGYSAAEYSISVTISTASQSQATQSGRNASDKVPYTEPYVALESKPGDRYALPPAETTASYSYIFLPLVVR